MIDSAIRRFEPGYEYAESIAGLGSTRYTLVRMSDHVILARSKSRESLERLRCPLYDGVPEPGWEIFRR